MVFNTLNQYVTNNFNLIFTSLLGSNFGNNNSNSYYAKKGEPGYQEDMDSDKDGIVTNEDFRKYCKDNNISAKDMSKMLQLKTANQNINEQLLNQAKKSNKEEQVFSTLELIYAEENDSNYDEEQDVNDDSKVSYEEYLRYCEQNARMEAKNSDTKIRQNDKSKFMTVSYGKITNSYNKIEQEAPEGKVVDIA